MSERAYARELEILRLVVKIIFLFPLMLYFYFVHLRTHNITNL